MIEGEGTEFIPDRNEISSRSTSLSESNEQPQNSYLLIPYGFQPKACYKPKAKSKEITGVTYNSRSRQFIILDSKGITAWSHNSVINAVSRLLDYPSYQFNLIQLMLHSKKFNVYFGLSKDYALKVFNLNFHEVFSVISDMNSVLCMVFNSVTDELITGGTGGIKFWTFGEINSDERSVARDSRPMANYGLILRREHPAVNGTMVKDIILDERNQRLYCLSERNVVAYDMKGNFLFELKSANQGQVTGCVFSKFSNFVVTAGTDCAVNVWSSNGGCLHSFCSHSKMVTNLLLHPEAPSLVITSSQDGTVKIFSLDIMEEIYSQVVFPEGVEWMNFLSPDILYCATNKALQVFSINHVTNFWTTVRCPLRSLSLTAGSHDKGQKVLAIAEDYSARFLSKSGGLLSTVLPPPPVTTGQQSQRCSAHAYCPIYGLMYLLVNQEEIWVYYTKSNPANRVEVWNLTDTQDISINRETPASERPRTLTPCERVSSRIRSSPSPFNPPAKIVDGVPCLSIAFLNSTVNLKNKAGESYTDLVYYLVAGLQDGRLLFTSAFSALILYFQFQATKGAVLSIKHDMAASLLLLNTITLNKYTIQIRGLPDLVLKHQVDVGNDLTCFVRMGCSFLTGHETGRLSLCRLISEQVTCEVDARTSDGQKLSKDHLAAVLTVDANTNLQLFCSSSKDGCIKIWNNTKLLLREIIMDKTLTAVCFLNSSGDLLAGFKNHLFFISREKAHLTSFSNNAASSRRNSELGETGSDIYEDPRVRFEYKKLVPSEPVRMETYLVPFANISVNLARFLSGQVQPNTSLENDMESENDGTESELSNVFSVAPTDIYMSQSGTPFSRSRSSSLVSSWNLPNIGSSPVSSPPRTPPPFMSPVLELESDDENTTVGNEISENDQGKYITSDNELGKLKLTAKKPVTPVVFSRQKRLGLSERKIDSRALQSKVSVNVAKNAESLQSKRGKREDTTNSTTRQVSNSTTSSRPARTVAKKIKKQTGKIQRKATSRVQPPSSEVNNMAENLSQVQDNPEQPNSEGDKINAAEEMATVKLIEEKELNEDTQESIIPGRNENKLSGLQGDVTSETMSDQEEGFRRKQVDNLLVEKEGLTKPELERDFVVTEHIRAREDGLPEMRESSSEACFEQDEDSASSDGDAPEKDEMMEPSVHDFLPARTPSREDSLNNSMSNLNLQGSLEELQLPSNTTDRHEDLEYSNVSEEDRVVSKQEESTVSSSDSEDKPDTPSGTPDMFIPKTVSFHVSDVSQESKPRGMLPSRSTPKLNRPGRRSVSPVNFSSKVVPALDSDGTQGQRLHPNSALKIYALARTRQRSPSGQSLVSRPRVKQRSFVKHNISEASFGDDFTSFTNDVVGGKIDRTPRTVVDIQGNEETVKDKERHARKEKKDLISWCITALSEKAKYPIFSPKPRLRSRRSLLQDKDKSTAAFVTTVPDSNGHHHYVGHVRPGDNTKKYRRRDVLESRNSFEKHGERCVRIKEIFHSEASRHSEGNVLDYSEGWQERLLDKAREMKAKHLERKRKVFKKLEVERQALDEKQRVLELYGSTGIHKDNSDMTQGINMDKNGHRWIKVDDDYESLGICDDRNLVNFDKNDRAHGINMDKKQKSYGMNTDSGDCSRGVNVDIGGYIDMQSDGKDLKRVPSSYETFKNNPVVAQPFRLEKFNSTKDEISLHGLNVDLESSELPDHLVELIARPKSAPSIPSKCRKYVLVATESENTRERPAPTALEEMLMLQRFPRSNLGKFKSRSYSPLQVSEIRRPYFVQKLQNVDMSCK